MNKTKLSIAVANPSGNITIFVFTPVAEKDFADIAKKLLSIERLHGEQVAFIHKIDDSSEVQGSMFMSGLEFCGNASRSFALLTAKELGLTGVHNLKISVSGTPHPIEVLVNTLKNTAKIAMPLPSNLKPLNAAELSFLKDAMIAEFDGILHVVISSSVADTSVFEKIKTFIMETYNPAALGVMFFDSATLHMIPVVYVRDVDSTYFEGSCASGTTALCAVLSENEESGTFTYTITQPEGVLTASVEKKNHKILHIAIDGTVELFPCETVYLDC